MARVLARLLWLTVAIVLPIPSSSQPIETDSSHHEPWLGPDGPLPFQTEEEVLSFLRTAEIVAQKELTGGVNRPLKVRLAQNGVEANAIFRIVDVRRPRAKIDGKLISDFHDSYIYECAAWKVSRLLGIDNVPPCVQRRHELKNGTMQLWVENAITEEQRRERGSDPPEQLKWMRQKQTMRLFDALIYNFDRNQGNMLIDEGWKLWFIDHTRSFKKSTAVERPERIIWCEESVFEALQNLDKPTLTRELRGLISGLKVNQLLKRRDKLVAVLRSRIDEIGEEAVLYEPSSPAEITEEIRRATADDDIPVTSSQVEEPG